ncbi:MAG: CsbD family protein [Hellea sp.]|nr:CsbD family protein [Hellea sp.]
MESEHIKGAANKIAGKIKEETGDAIDNTEMELKGKAQQQKGRAQCAVGDAKDAVE